MKKLLVLAVVLLQSSTLSAGFISGPGNINTTNGDQAFDIIAVDLNQPVTLSAGEYVASKFNYQFTDFSGFQTTGKIAPLLLTGNGTDTFTPIAIGETITYNGATAFVTDLFGGDDTFTLSTSTTVYAGLYWDEANPPPGGLEVRMPVGFLNNTGSVFVIFGGGFGPGANPPIVGTQISGSTAGHSQGSFSRTYDFSIEIEQVPAPPSFLLGLISIGVIGCVWRRFI